MLRFGRIRADRECECAQRFGDDLRRPKGGYHGEAATSGRSSLLNGLLGSDLRGYVMYLEAMSGLRASSDSTLGQLQRGLGRGYRRAVASGDAESVFECVVQDPRWDRQVEERASYYANLLIALAPPLHRLSEAIDGWQPHSDSGYLVADVLVEMSRRGQQRATQILRDGFCADAWSLVLEAAYGVDDSSLVADAGLSDAEVLDRLITVEPEDLLRFAEESGGLPWERWAPQLPALSDFCERYSEVADYAARRSWVVESSSSTEDLLRLALEHWRQPRLVATLLTRTDAQSRRLIRNAALGENPQLWMLACRILGMQDDQTLVPAAIEALERAKGPFVGRRCVAWTRYLAELPSTVTLPLARRWMDAADTLAVSVAGRRLIAQHCETSDLPLIVRKLESAIAEDDVYLACSMVEALEHVGLPGNGELLARVYCESPYSYIRRRVLRALRVTGEVMIERLAFESLWDCDSGARLEAVELAPMNEMSERRTKVLASDEFEEHDIREAARKKLDR